MSKPVTLKFLYEVSAIPREIREKYLKKLITNPVTGKRRKNSSRQKNVRLLKIIYSIINENKMLDWDEGAICRKLDVSKSMLYCHKHYLLKGLREMYFGSKEIEKEKDYVKDSKDYETDAKTNYVEAERLYRLGMHREAKNEYLKLYRRMQKNETYDDIQWNLLYMKLVTSLCEYYHHQKDRRKVNKFYLAAERIREKLDTTGLPSNINAEIKLSEYRCTLYKENFKVTDDSTQSRSIELVEKCYEQALELEDINLQTDLLVRLGVLFQNQSKYEKAKSYFAQGEAITTATGMRNRNIVFRISSLLMEYESGSKGLSESIDEMMKLYHGIDNKGKERLDSHLKKYILFQLIRTISGSPRKDLLYKLLKEYNSHCIITDGYKTSLRMLYFMKFSYYLDRMVVFKFTQDKKTNHTFLTVPKTEEQFFKKLETAETELLMNFDKMYVIYFTMEAYMNILLSEFWKGRRLDYERAMFMIRKIEWLNRSRKKIFHSAYKLQFEILKYCIMLIEESKYLSDEELSFRYEQKFTEYANRLLGENIADVVTVYSVFSYTAEQTGNSRLKEVTNSLYTKLEQKHPGAFDTVKEEATKRLQGIEPDWDTDVDILAA